MKFCKRCLQHWKTEQLKNARKQTCPYCNTKLTPGPVLVDGEYWRAIQQLYPNAVNQRRAALQSTHPGYVATGAAGGAAMPARGAPNCNCRTSRPAQRRGPVQNATDPKHNGCYYWVCADRPRTGVDRQKPHCKFWFWEEPGASGAPAAAFTQAGGAARGQEAARAAPAPAPRRVFF